MCTLVRGGVWGADRLWLCGESVFLQLREERFVVDVERFRRVGLVAAAGVEDALDVEPFDLFQGQVRVISRVKRAAGFRQQREDLFSTDRTRPMAHQHNSLKNIAQFTHVAGPTVGGKRLHGLRCEGSFCGSGDA